MDADILCEFKNPKSRAVTLVFSEFLPADRGLRSFSFRHILSTMPANILYVKDRGNQWYNRGVYGLGDDVGSVARALKAVITENGFREVRCLGTSMGGYASLMFGRELQADAILAFAPQTFLAPPYPRFAKAVHSGDYLDLSTFEARPAARTRIVIAKDELFDIYGAIRLPYWRDVDLQVIKTANHLVARALNDAGTFKDILAEFVQNGTYRDLGVELSDIDFAPLRDDLLVAVEAFYRRDNDRALEVLRSFVGEIPSWAGAHWWLGRVLADRKEHDRAVEHLQTAISLNPALYEASGDITVIKTTQKDWLGMLYYMMLTWEANKSFVGLRDRSLATALNAIKSAVDRNEVDDVRCLFERLKGILERPDFSEHPLKGEIASIGSAFLKGADAPVASA